MFCGDVTALGLCSYNSSLCGLPEAFWMPLGVVGLQGGKWLLGPGVNRSMGPCQCWVHAEKFPAVSSGLCSLLPQVRTNVPSWCDRILWKSYPETHIICNSYGQSLPSRVGGRCWVVTVLPLSSFGKGNRE